MNFSISRIIGSLLVVFLCVSFRASAIAGGGQKTSGSQRVLEQRIDFGNAQILGQSIKSGAVYLMHRKRSDIQNMIQVRQDYRLEIKEDYDLAETAIANGSDAHQGAKDN